MARRTAKYTANLLVSNERSLVQDSERRDAIKNLYNSFKSILLPLYTGYIRNNIDTLTDGDVVTTINIGQNNFSDIINKEFDGKMPELNLNKDRNLDDTWSLQQILDQYISGVKGGHEFSRTLPGFAMNETLRYLHVNPSTKETAPVEISQKTSFKPVLPNKICQKGAYIIMTNIIPADSDFLKTLNAKIAKLNPNFKLVVEEVPSSNSYVVLNGNKLTLSSSFVNLVLRIEGTKRTVTEETVRKAIPLSQDDER
jgi:hypothetical protein